MARGSDGRYAWDGVVHQGNRLRTQQIMTDERDVMARGNYKAIPPDALARDGAEAFARVSPKWRTCAVVARPPPPPPPPPVLSSIHTTTTFT